MLKYVIKRILQLIPTLFLVSILVFSMVRIIPGDPITLLYGLSESGGASEEYLDSMREKYGLNDSIVEQYFRWIGNFLRAIWARPFIPIKRS
jgi:peptide/nickel transport system permease protein